MATKPTNSWDETKPAGTRDVNLGDNDIREMKTQIREVIAADHEMGSSGQSENTGFHNLVTLLVQTTIAALANAGRLYTKDVEGKAELHFLDEDDNEIQITSVGKILAASINPGEDGQALKTNGLAVEWTDDQAPTMYDQNFTSMNNSGTPDTSIDVNADMLAIESVNGTAVDLTIDCTTTGANALDTGSLAADTWYYVWAIAKTDGTIAGLISLSSTDPTLPEGYTLKRRVGRCVTDGSSHFKKFRQLMNYIEWDTTTSILTDIGLSASWVGPLSCNSSGKRGISPDSIRAKFLVNDTLGSEVGIQIGIRPYGSSGGSQIQIYGVNYVGGPIESFTDSSQRIDYAFYASTGSSNGSIGVQGFYIADL